MKSLANFTHHNKRHDSAQRHLSLHAAIAAENAAMQKASSFGVRNENEDDSDEKTLTDVYFEVIGGLRPGVRIAQTEAYIKRRAPKWANGGGGGDGDDGGDDGGDGDGEEENSEAALAADPKVARAKETLKRYREKFEDIEKNGGRETTRNIDSWTAVYDILTSPNCFAESIFDLSGISQIMSNVAKIDNLPDKHSREALSLIQHAWSNVDAYHTSASWYKWTAKACYLLMLSLAICIVAVGVASTAGAKTPVVVPRSLGNYLILGLSLMNAVIASLTTYMNPAVRWQLLRSSALSLESEIWQFRTRTGKYRESRASSSRNAEKHFHKAIKEVENLTLQSGDLRHTTFYSKPKSQWTRHGQHGSKACCCCCRGNGSGGRVAGAAVAAATAGGGKTNIVPVSQVNNHHSPLRPEEYLMFRLKPAQKFYMDRLPRYSKSRTLTKAITILGSIAGSILAVFDLSEYSVLVVVLISSVVAWSEFAGTEKKLERYSTVVSGLGQILLWWNALPLVEKLATKSIDNMVSQVEGQIRSEQQNWRATSQAAKKMQQAVDNADGSNGSAEGRGGGGGGGGGESSQRGASTPGGGSFTKSNFA